MANHRLNSSLNDRTSLDKYYDMLFNRLLAMYRLILSFKILKSFWGFLPWWPE
jgi:hypothetical protein